MRCPSRLPAAAASLLLTVGTSGSLAQVATAILRTGEPIAIGGPTVSAINNTAVNAVGGYALTVNTSDAISHVWGNLAGGPGLIIRSEGTYDSLIQTGFETFFGIGATTVAYSPSGSDGAFTGLDAVYLNDDRVMAERDPHPTLPGQFWSFGSRPTTTTDGIPWFVGGITTVQGGTTQNRGLFRNDTAILLGGQFVPGLVDPLNTATAVDFDYRVSQSGTHFIAPVVLTGATAADSAIVIDGIAATAGGFNLREGTLVPTEIGGDGTESYQSFDFLGITDSGSWMVTGDTGRAATTDEYVMRDGIIVLRDGDDVGGNILQGDIEGAYLNNDGDYAVIWDVAANTLEILVINGAGVLREGDEVDWDGDGAPDAGVVITDFTGISTLTLSNRDNGAVTAYFTANVSVGGSTVEGAFKLQVLVVDACACDWDGSGALNSQDFFDFLQDFFADNADFNGDLTTNSQDFFDFLACFFKGCP